MTAGVRRITIDPARPDPDAVSEVSDLLLSDGVVVIPTDTVYGLAASVWNDEAVERLFAIKGRDRGRPREETRLTAPELLPPKPGNPLGLAVKLREPSGATAEHLGDLQLGCER